MTASNNEKAGTRAWIGVFYSKILDAFHLYIAMCLSDILVNNIVVGGAIYLLAQVVVVFARLYGKHSDNLLPHSIQARGIVIFVVTALLTTCLLIVYPSITTSTQFQYLWIGLLLLLLRQFLSELVYPRMFHYRVWRFFLLFSINSICSIAIAMLYAPLLADGQFRDIMTMVIATGVTSLAYQITTVPEKREKAPPPSTDRLMSVSSYRIYNRMTANMMAALNIALLTYICYMQVEAPAHSILERFWNLAVWLALNGGIILLVLRFFSRQDITKYDKPSVFAAGAAMLGFAIWGTYQNWFSGIWAVIGYLLWGGGLAVTLSVLIAMGADMRAVFELNMEEAEYRGYQENTHAVVEWSLTLSTFLVLLMLTVVTFVAEGALLEFQDIWEQHFSVQWLLFLPPLFVFIAMISALMQPLNRDYARKLAHFRVQQRVGKANPALETQLQLKLVKQTRRIAPSILRAIIRPILPCKVVGKEHVDEENGPVVFVCNHLEIYGPLITNLHLPFYFRSWVISKMLDSNAIADQLESGVEIIFHWLPSKLRARLPKWFAPIILYILNALDPIPVYRGNMREVLQTLRLTVDAMEYEDNILIFPENPLLDDGQYKVNGVSPFYSGFAAIGSEYYKRTGNCTTFYPMYANKTQRTLTIGEGVRYQPENGRSEEKERIVNTLYQWMCNAAKE